MKGFLKFNKFFHKTTHIHKLSHKKVQNILLVVLPLLLFLHIIIFYKENSRIIINTEKISLKDSSFSNYAFAPYPILENTTASTLNFPIAQNILETKSILSAQAAIVIDNDSQVILLSKNANSVFSMASTTKMMTALVGLDHYRLDDVITIKKTDVDGAIVGFKMGQQILFKDILFAMLLPSGNDAALAIAQNYPGGEKEFVKKMNEKADELHLISTSFSDSTGLSPHNVTTASDLAQLSSASIKNSLLASIVATKKYTITDISGSSTYSLTNLNKLLGLNGVNGIKTGYTEEAGEVLSTSRLINGHTIISIVMKSKNRFLDTQSLLTFINSTVNYINVEEFIEKY